MVIAMSSGGPIVSPVRIAPSRRAGMIGVLPQRPRHIGHAVIDAAALALDQRQRLAGLEALLQHRRSRHAS